MGRGVDEFIIRGKIYISGVCLAIHLALKMCPSVRLSVYSDRRQNLAHCRALGPVAGSQPPRTPELPHCIVFVALDCLASLRRHPWVVDVRPFADPPPPPTCWQQRCRRTTRVTHLSPRYFSTRVLLQYAQHVSITALASHRYEVLPYILRRCWSGSRSGRRQRVTVKRTTS